MRSMVTDLPFKVSEATIAILKEVPVFQRENCSTQDKRQALL